MTHITSQILANAINEQQSDFDSNDIVRFLYTKYQHEYLSELNLNATAKFPFTETHRQLGQELAKLTNLIRKIEKISSEKTMRGKRTLVQKWRRV